MGIAAYNRGSRVVAESIRATTPDYLLSYVCDLNNIPKLPGAGTPFHTAEGLSLSPGNNGWWLTCNVTGYGYLYKTPREAMAHWNIEIVGVSDIADRYPRWIFTCFPIVKV